MFNNYKVEVPASFEPNAEIFVFESQDAYIPDENVDQHIQELPAQIAHWTAVLAYYLSLHSSLKSEMSFWEAACKSEIRPTLGTKYTEKQLNEALVMTNTDTYKRMDKGIIDAQYRVDVIKAVCKALDTKKDMLVTFGANRRAEMKSGILISTPETKN